MTMCILPVTTLDGHDTSETAESKAKVTDADLNREERKKECRRRSRSRTSSGSASDTTKAASQGNVERLKLLADVGFDLAAGDYDYRTPLHLAVDENHLHVVQYLLEKCRVPHNQLDRWGESPLDIAKKKDNKEIIEYINSFIKRQREGKLLDIDQDETSLEWGHKFCEAAALGQLETIQEYVERGFDPIEADYDGRTALHLACSEGHTEIVNYLLKVHPECYRPVDRCGNTPMRDAERSDHKSIVQILKTHKRKLRGHQTESSEGSVVCKSREKLNLTDRLIKAIKVGDPQRCENVLSQADDAGVTEEICQATELHYVEWQESLNKMDRDCDEYEEISQNKTPLLEIGHAPQNGFEIMQLFLKRKLNIEPDIKSEIMEVCIRKKQHKILDLFLETTKAPCNVTGQGGRRPLYTAIEMGDDSAVKMLLEHEADPKETPEQYSHSPINFCIRSQLNAQLVIKILEMLIKYGADPSTPGYHGLRPVHHAIITPRSVSERKCLIKFLKTVNAKLDATDRNGHTILQYASGDSSYRPTDDEMSSEDRQNLVKFLIEEGANLDHQGKDGNSMLHTAAKSDNHQVVEMLLKKGANVRLKNIARYTAEHLAPENSRSKAMLMDAMDTNTSLSVVATRVKKRRGRRKRKQKKAEAVEHSEWPNYVYNIPVQDTSYNSLVPIENYLNTVSGTRHDSTTSNCTCSTYNASAFDGNGNEVLSLEVRKQMRKKNKILVEDAFQFLSRRLGHNYKTFLRCLYKGKDFSEIEAILDGLDLCGDLQERAIQGLRAWRVWKGYSAGLSTIHRALVDCNLSTLITEFNRHYIS